MNLKKEEYIEENLSLDEELEDTQKDKYLTFRLAKEDFGIPIICVIEIVGIQGIKEVPDLPDFVKGVINLRGRIIPVIDVRTRFQMPQRSYDDRTCVIVVSHKDNLVGLVVDTVNEVITIPAEQITPPPQMYQSGKEGHYIQGIGRVGESVKILLDLNKLLHEGKIEQLTNSAAQTN